MTDSRSVFPVSDGTVFLTDGGLETTLLFLRGIDLPCFAAFPLLLTDDGRRELEDYFEPFIRTAAERKTGFILDTPTWRANPDWGAKLGYSPDAIADINRRAIVWAKTLRDRFSQEAIRIMVDGAIGPRGDGYRPGELMTPEQAQDYHSLQVNAFHEARADMVTAFTMNYAEEAIGIANAARAAGLPVVISFTVETDGKLASGETLQSAIERTDRATDGAPAYYMINCAHPTHFENALSTDEAWTRRIGGLRANASRKSHAELDEAVELDPGDPIDLGQRYRALRGRFKNLAVLGGCCGTDHRHIAAICDACLPA